jgi:transcriptional regulator with XRE-family HTH domain
MICSRLRDMREDADMSQRQVASYLNVHQTTYSDYELGNLNIPVRVLIKLAELYNTSIDYIVGHTDERRPYPHALQRQTGAL